MARLHQAYILDTIFQGDEMLKRESLEAYYRGLIHSEHSLLIVAVIPLGVVIGYAALTSKHMQLLFQTVKI